MIRRLDPLADRTAVTDLYARAADYGVLERGAVAPEAQAADLLDATGPHGALALGAEGAGGLDGVLGMIFGYPEPADAYVGLLLLAPEARGRGLGPKLVAAAETEARARGAARMLVAGLDANPRGRRFWEREGFREERRFADLAYGARVHDVTRLTRALP